MDGKYMRIWRKTVVKRRLKCGLLEVYGFYFKMSQKKGPRKDPDSLFALCKHD